MSEEEKEIWKPVVGWEQHYQVSNFGRVLCTRIDGRMKRVAKRILKTSVVNGFLRVSLYDEESKRYSGRFVHILAVESFVGPVDRRHTIIHLDEDRSNNRLSNLVWAKDVSGKSAKQPPRRMRQEQDREPPPHTEKYFNLSERTKKSIANSFKWGRPKKVLARQYQLNENDVTAVIRSHAPW